MFFNTSSISRDINLHTRIYLIFFADGIDKKKYEIENLATQRPFQKVFRRAKQFLLIIEIDQDSDPFFIIQKSSLDPINYTNYTTEFSLLHTMSQV